ncbi:alanine racemase [Paenibacillus spongiae]|uniref:Alanine racemase n=1 Tax=Paenibacillus spongiae TaxID=2909671 RepID=A0ABY5SCG0_9BACL|nr:alanine racemase [Paenibacillus spongiae]UVI31349.1 alanine racemase [Paenibacillus spongiae]
MGELHSTAYTELDTPVIIIDLDVLDRNLQKTAGLARDANVKLRPHFKTHKSVWIAKEQFRYGACGLTVAKLGEAEVLVDAGIDDLLVAYPIVGRAKLARLAKLLERARIIVGIDNLPCAEGLSELGQSLNKRIEIYVDVNTGLNRCGQEPGEESAELVKNIAKLPGVEVIGLMTHGGYAYGVKTVEGLRAAAKQEAEGLLLTKRLLADAGIEIREISVGSTPTSKFIGELEGVTEIRPGAYVFGDISQLAIGVITPEECAMHVLTTVVSAPRKGTIIIDAGSKTLSGDASSHWPGFGIMKDNREVYAERLSEEHANVRIPDNLAFQVGDRIMLLPNHCCAVTNLHDRLQGVRGDRAERMITVDARGQIR